MAAPPPPPAPTTMADVAQEALGDVAGAAKEGYGAAATIGKWESYMHAAIGVAVMIVAIIIGCVLIFSPGTVGLDSSLRLGLSGGGVILFGLMVGGYTIWNAFLVSTSKTYAASEGAGAIMDVI